MRPFFLLVFFFFFSKGQSQVLADSIFIENNYRVFYYQQTVVKKNASLMFVLHGSGGSGKGIMNIAKNLQATATKENLILVYPNGYKNYWNECRKFATSEANTKDINDNQFFISMINYFKDKYNIDTNKVYAAGFSGGGHMAYKLALTIPNKIKAIAAIVANMTDSASCDCSYANKALPVLIVNGTADNVNPYNGGEMFVNNVSYGVVKSTINTFLYFSTLAGYKTFPSKISMPNKDTTDNSFIESHTLSSKNKPTIKLLTVIGGKHEFPKDIDVFLYAWQFFKDSSRKKRF